MLLHMVVSRFSAAKGGKPKAQALTKHLHPSYLLVDKALDKASHMAKPSFKDCRNKLHLLMGRATKYCGHFLNLP